MKAIALILLMMILLISACTPVQEIPIGVNVSIPDAPVVVPNETQPESIVEVEPEPIEVPSPTDNSSLAERTREARYGTLIDLTQLTAINCEETLDNLDEQLAEELYEEGNVKDDIRDQEREVADVENDVETARGSSNDRDLIRAKDELEKEGDYLQDLKNERYKIHRKVLAIKETIDRAEPRCQAMTKGKYR